MVRDRHEAHLLSSGHGRNRRGVAQNYVLHNWENDQMLDFSVVLEEERQIWTRKTTDRNIKAAREEAGCRCEKFLFGSHVVYFLVERPPIQCNGQCSSCESAFFVKNKLLVVSFAKGWNPHLMVGCCCSTIFLTALQCTFLTEAGGMLCLFTYKLSSFLAFRCPKLNLVLGDRLRLFIFSIEVCRR